MNQPLGGKAACPPHHPQLETTVTKRPLIQAAPPKPWDEMTDEDCDAFADALFDKMIAKLPPKSPTPTSAPK